MTTHPKTPTKPETGTFAHAERALRRRLGRTIYGLRAERKMTLKKLSRLARLHPDYLEKMELGKCGLELRHIVRIAAAFEISPERLFLNRLLYKDDS